MICPWCGKTNVLTIDSRDANEEGTILYDKAGIYTIRRKRCMDCNHKWTTYELPVVKTQLQAFSRILNQELYCKCPYCGSTKSMVKELGYYNKKTKQIGPNPTNVVKRVKLCLTCGETYGSLECTRKGDLADDSE